LFSHETKTRFQRFQLHLRLYRSASGWYNLNAYKYITDNMKGKDKIREVKHDGQSKQFYKNKHGRK
jgi:hypothetical protein